MCVFLSMKNFRSTYFLKNEHDNEISSIKDQIKNLESNLNSLFIYQSAERKKIANQLQNLYIFFGQ